MVLSSRAWRMGLAITGFVALGAGPSAAQNPIESFYKGKTITLAIGFSAGGEYDLHARLVARFIGKHLPGNPNVVPTQMTGAGTITLANYMAAVAPKDGTYLGVISNGIPASQAIGSAGIKFDSRQFHWIGALGPTIETQAVWHAAGVTTLEEARKKEVVVGATGRGSATFIMPTVMNEMFGTRFKIVTGYRGGSDVNVAMERGEVGSRNNSWTSWKSTKPHWLSDKQIHIIAWAGPDTKELAHIPHLSKIAKDDADRQVVDVVFSGSYLGRPILTTPGVPAERVKALRDAFDATMKEPEFIAAATQAKVELSPLKGVDMQQVVERVMATPAPLVARAKALME
jgi:tripartite-type tricarboxylate transporter receptor subunit TctC